MNGYDNITIEEARKLYEMAVINETVSKYSFPTKPSSDGYYHIQIPDGTKKSGRRQVKDKDLDNLKKKVYQIEKGIDTDIRKTFKDVFNLVQDEKIKYIKNKDKLLSVENTLRKTRFEYQRFFDGTHFEKMYVDEITKKDVENFCVMNLTRLDLREKAFLSMRSILKSVFDYSFNEYLINDNIYNRIDFKKYKDMLIEPTSVTKRVHSDAEFDRILEYVYERELKNPSSSTAFALELQILMGARRGEIPALKFSDIYEDYIYISKEQINHVIVEHTKTHKDRMFPITDDIRTCLEKIYSLHENYYPESLYLFPNNTGVDPISNNTVYSFYRRMCDHLGIKLSHEARRGPHSFRRNGITKVVNQTNGNIMMASQLFGNTPNVAKNNYYTGLDLKKAKEVLEIGKQR